jgi:hypothetical protein
MSADIVVMMALSVTSVNAQSGTSAGRDTYSSKTAETYNYRFGKDHTFLPSNIQTNDGEFIAPKDFPAAEYCGHRHQEGPAQLLSEFIATFGLLIV